MKFYFHSEIIKIETKFPNYGPYLLYKNYIMSNVKQFEVKVQLQGGKTMVTVIFAENDFRARELIRMQFGSELSSIHYVREMK